MEAQVHLYQDKFLQFILCTLMKDLKFRLSLKSPAMINKFF